MEFDEHLISAARLSIVAALISGETLSFMQLKRVTKLADGNLHVQCRKLADVDYIEIRKGLKGRRSYTSFRLTERVIAAMKLHVRKLNSILAMESGEISLNPGAGRDDDAQVWS